MNTTVTVISAVIGGAAGKLIARYAFRWKKAQRLVESLWDIGGKMKTLAGDFMKSRKALGAAEGCVRRKNSFAAGTMVVLADGSRKPIENSESVMRSWPRIQ